MASVRPDQVVKREKTIPSASEDMFWFDPMHVHVKIVRFEKLVKKRPNDRVRTLEELCMKFLLQFVTLIHVQPHPHLVC